MRWQGQPSNRALDRFARSHFLYELQALTAQARELHRRSPDHDVELNQYDPAGLALLEATLIHLRLLNYFFCKDSRRHRLRDACAWDWLPSWQMRRVLTEPQERIIGAGLVHLSAGRRLGTGWDPPKMTTRCCKTAEQFFTQVEHDSPGRLRAFESARSVTRVWLDEAA
jgi:hypothetical protein